MSFRTGMLSAVDLRRMTYIFHSGFAPQYLRAFLEPLGRSVTRVRPHPRTW